jgi:hypothetical protein
MAQVAQCLPSKCKSLNLNPSTAKKNYIYLIPLLMGKSNFEPRLMIASLDKLNLLLF